jgi:hypothetical protein
LLQVLLRVLHQHLAKIKRIKKLNNEDEGDKEPVRKGSRTAQTPTIGKRDLTGSGGPSPTATRNGVPMIPNIVSSPMFDKKVKSAAQTNKTLSSPHRLPDDENDFGTSSMPGTPTGEKAESPSAARKTLSSDSPRLKKLIRVKSMGSPMESPLVSKKDRTDQLVLGEYSLKNSVSEPVLSNPSSEGGSLSDDESSAEDIELVDDNSSNASSQPEEGRRESVVSDDANLPVDIDLHAEGEQDPEKLQLLQEKIISLQDEAEKLNSLINDLKIPLSDLEGDQNAVEDTKSKIAEKEGELKKLTEQLGELMQEKGLKKKKSTRTLSRSGSFNNSKKKKRTTLKRSKSGHLSDGKVKRTSSRKRVRDLVTEVEGDKKIVKGGSIVELVNAFAKKDIKDFDYVESFILTHQTFMTSDQLVDLLIEKYKSAPEEKDNSSSARSALETMDSSTDSTTSSPAPKRKSKYSRRRILNLMRMWIVKCPQDFIKFNNVPFFEKVRTFVSNSFDETRSPIAQDALDILDGKKDLSLPSAEMVFSPTKPINSKGNKPGAMPEFMEWNEKEVAKQLTMWTHELFKKIKPSECFGKGWSKGEEYANEKAPNVWQMIQRFNQVSTWVATEIVKQDALKQRVKIVKKLLQIAQHCRELNNFETAMAFVSGLQTTAVDRLKDTWKKIEAKPKLWATFQDLVKLFDSEGNFQEYRNAMKGISNSPAIPYLGLSLRLLTYIEDGNENDFGKKLNRKDLINFDKRRKLAHVVADIIKWQNTSYAIEKDTTMIKYLESAETFNETLLWKQSQICEARKGKSPSMDN